MIKMTQVEFDSQIDKIVSEDRGENEIIHSKVVILLLETIKSFGIKLDHYDKALYKINFWYD